MQKPEIKELILSSTLNNSNPQSVNTQEAFKTETVLKSSQIRDGRRIDSVEQEKLIIDNDSSHRMISINSKNQKFIIDHYLQRDDQESKKFFQSDMQSNDIPFEFQQFQKKTMNGGKGVHESQFDETQQSQMTVIHPIYAKQQNQINQYNQNSKQKLSSDLLQKESALNLKNQAFIHNQLSWYELQKQKNDQILHYEQLKSKNAQIFNKHYQQYYLQNTQYNPSHQSQFIRFNHQGIPIYSQFGTIQTSPEMIISSNSDPRTNLMLQNQQKNKTQILSQNQKSDQMMSTNITPLQNRLVSNQEVFSNQQNHRRLFSANLNNFRSSGGNETVINQNLQKQFLMQNLSSTKQLKRKNAQSNDSNKNINIGKQKQMNRVNSTHEKANHLHHQQRMQDFAQKKLSQLLFYDEVNGHFKLVSSALSGAEKSTSQSAFGVFDTSKESSQNYKVISADQNFKLQKQTLQRERNIQKRAEILKKQQRQKLQLFNSIRDGIQNQEDENKELQQITDQNILNKSKQYFSPDINMTLDQNQINFNHKQQIDLKSRKFFMKNEQFENKRNFHKEYQQKVFESQKFIQNQEIKNQQITQEDDTQNQFFSQNYGSELQEQNVQSQNSGSQTMINSSFLVQNIQKVESMLQKQYESSQLQNENQEFRNFSPWHQNLNSKIEENDLSRQNKDAGTFQNDPESLSFISLKNQKKIFNEENPMSQLKPDQYLKFQHSPSPEQILKKLDLIKDELNFQVKQNSVISNYIQSNKDYEIQTQKSLLFKQNQQEKLIFVNKNSPLKQKKKELKKIGQEFLEQHPAQIQGVDQTQLDKDRIQSANTDFSVTLDFQKEFIHHKRVLCSLREICNFDIQHQWDVGFCKTFCSNLKEQHFSEQQIDLTKEHTYIEKYESDQSIKNALKNILKEKAQVEDRVQSQFAKNYFSEQDLVLEQNFDELQEGYASASKTFSNGFGIQDFSDKFVLRFKNQHEISLYFDIVDQLKHILILKGKKEMFVNENYQSLMDKFIELCKNYMMFLCKDDEYYNYISSSKENEFVKTQQTQRFDLENTSKKQNTQEKINLNNEYTEEQIQFKLQINQMNRERQHRSFIKAFLFDSIFKIFIQILDEALYNKELLIKIKQKEWKIIENKKLQYFKNEIIDLQNINENLKKEHQIEIDELLGKIKKLKESQIEIQHSLEDYKYDLNRLTQINVREEKIEGLRRHVQEAHEFIRLTEIQMEEQEDIIFPVLGMINIVAKNPHFKEQGMQTECQINSFMAHVLTQIDSKALQDFGNTSLSQMEQVISQIFILKDQEESQQKEEQIIKKKALIQKKKAPKQSSINMKQLKTKITNNIEQNQGSALVQNLLNIENEVVTLDELQKQMMSYIQDFEKLLYQSQKIQSPQSNQNWTLGDYICNQLLQQNENIINASLQLHKLLINIRKQEHDWHPLIKLSKKLLGICGYQKPDQQMLIFLFGLKEQMEVSSINDNATLNSSIDVIQKSFAANKSLLCQIQENIARYIAKSEMDKLRIISMDSIVNEETFGLPTTFSGQQQQKFFKQLQAKFNGQFFHQFTLMILQIVVKFKSQKIEIKRLFSNNPNDEETDSKIVTHTKKDFYSKLTKDGKVVLSLKQKEILDWFIDPEEKCIKNPKTKLDIKHFVEICEKQQTLHILKSYQVPSSQVLNCIYDQIQNLINFQLPFQIEQAVRKKMQVISTVANKQIIDLDQNQELIDKKSLENPNDQSSPTVTKKKSIIDKDLDYHISLNRFKIGLTLINEKMQALQSVTTPTHIKEQDNQINTKQSPQNIAKKTVSKPVSPHEQGHAQQNQFKIQQNYVFDDNIATSLTFLSLQNGKDVLNPLSKDLNGEKESKYFHFANNYLNKYYSIYSNPGNDLYNSQQFIIKDLLKQELVIQTKTSTSKNQSISLNKDNVQSSGNAEQQKN